MQKLSSVQQRLSDLVHHVRTQTVNAEVAEPPRVVGRVDRPDNDAPTAGMDGVDQFSVDHFTLRPEVACSGGCKRMRCVDEIRVGENAHRRSRRQFVNAMGNPVVEAVHRHSPIRMPRQAVGDKLLDAPRFHFNVRGDLRARRGEDGVEGRDPFPGRTDGCVGQRRGVQRGDRDTSQCTRQSREHRIVVNNDDPIPGTMDVELPASGTGRNGGEEPGQGILAVPARHATVGDQLRQRTTVRHGRGGEALKIEGRSGSSLNIASGAASAYQTDMPDVIRAGDDAEIDRALIARWNGGDERAATALVERHAPSLARFVGSLGVSVAPEEIVQDTFVRAFGSLDSFRGDSSLRSWLFTIARRLVLDLRRAGRHERNHVALEDAQDQLISSDDVLDGVVAEESEGRVREAVARLSPLQREVFTLRVVEGLSYKEIAVVASTTEGAARVHYHNAMRAVKEFLDA